jgi:hypothetical protein
VWRFSTSALPAAHGARSATVYSLIGRGAGTALTIGQAAKMSTGSMADSCDWAARSWLRCPRTRRRREGVDAVGQDGGRTEREITELRGWPVATPAVLVERPVEAIRWMVEAERAAEVAA